MRTSSNTTKPVQSDASTDEKMDIRAVDNFVSTVDNFNDSEPKKEEVHVKSDVEDVELDDSWFTDNSEPFVSSNDVGDIIGSSNELNRVAPPLETGGYVKIVIFAIFMSALLGLTVLLLYVSFIKYPARMQYTDEQKGIYHLTNYASTLKDINSLGDGTYLKEEITYANGDAYKVNFYQSMLNTVSYTPKKANVKNIYGNDYIDKTTKSTVSEDSVVGVDEGVYLHYIDYDNISIDEGMLSTICQKHEVKFGCTDYSSLLVDVFCDYMSNIPAESIPIKEEEYYPQFIEDKETGNLTLVTEGEDVTIDRLLFSGKSLYSFMDRFSETVAVVSGGEGIQPTEEWNTWNALTEEEKAILDEPVKYDKLVSLAKDWCGTYYLKNEYVIKDTKGNVIKTGISAMIGDGTLENPAGLDTPVNSVVFVNEDDGKGNVVEKQYPIKVILRDFRVSEDAIKWLESKDQRNRGIDVSSEVQYCVYTMEIVNLSDKELTINDNSILSDENINLSGRSGELFGLNTTLVLQPNESGVIESWNKSTELNTKYLIWGADFSRRTPPVFFRVLAGNIDDETEDKGVQTNKTRFGTEETSEELTSEVETTEEVESSENE